VIANTAAARRAAKESFFLENISQAVAFSQWPTHNNM